MEASCKPRRSYGVRHSTGNLPPELLVTTGGGVKMVIVTYTDSTRSVQDAVSSAYALDLAIMADVIKKSSRMTAGLVRKLRRAGVSVPPDVVQWEMDRLADAPENYDVFEEIRLEYSSNGAIADCW